jgi:hypothetical protein
MAMSLRTIRIPGYGTDSVPPIAFHPNEAWVAFAGVRENHISFVSCESGAIHEMLSFPEDPVELVFDAVGDHLLAFGNENIWIWQLTTHPVLRNAISASSRYEDDVWLPTLLEGDHCLWTLFRDEWRLWNASEGVVVTSMHAPPGERLLRVARSLSGEAVAVTYDDECANHPEYTLSVWSLRENRLLREIVHADWHDATVSPNASLATLERKAKSTTSVWDLEQGAYLRQISGICPTGHRHFCADNRHFVSEAPEGRGVPWTWLALTDVLTGQQTLIDPGTPYLPAFSCSPYHNLFVTVANDRRHPVDSTAFWNAASSQQIGRTSGHVGIARHRFSACGRWYATVSSDSGEEHAMDPLPGGSLVITDIRSLTQG